MKAMRGESEFPFCWCLIEWRPFYYFTIMNYYFPFHVQGDHRSFKVHSDASRDDFAPQGISFVKYVRVGVLFSSDSSPDSSPVD